MENTNIPPNNNDSDMKNIDAKRMFLADFKDDDTDDHESLEYEEDCYYAYVGGSATPSFDHSWSEDEINCAIDGNIDSGGSVHLEGPVDDSCSVETEFYLRTTNKSGRGVRVTFQDLSKPYLARVSSPRNYRKFLQLVKAEEPPVDMSPDSGINELQGLTPEEQERQRQDWQLELTKLEEEIQTLRHVLQSKTQQTQELKRKLGISIWKEFQDDMSQGIRNVKESNVYQNVEGKIGQFGKAVTDAPIYQKTESVIKVTAEKTTSLLGGFGSSVTSKLGQLKNSESFRSIEEKVGSAYENVKTKVVTSRSGSVQSFDEALREAERDRRPSNGATSPATSPTIPEDKLLS